MFYKNDPLAFYGAATNLVAPCLALVESAYYRLFRKFRWRDSVELFSQRLSLTSEVELKRTLKSPASLWFHGASLGETRTALAFCAAVLRNFYRMKHVLFPYEDRFKISSFLFTSANVAAQQPLLQGLEFLYMTSLEKGILADFQRRLVPYDVPRFVKRFLSRFAPRNAIFIESELWPVLLQESKNRGVRLFLLDGRLSPTSKQRWTSTHFGRTLLKQTLKSFDFIGARNDEEALFFKEFGCSNVKIIPPLKILLPLGPDEDSSSLLKEFGPSWMGISTHEQEDIALLRVHKRLCTTWRTGRKPLLILAPRHVERTPEIFRAAQFVGLKSSEIALHSQHSFSNKISLLIIDSYGVLSSFLRLCKVVFVGNSLIPPGGGHNIAEPLHYKCVVLHGTYMENFIETWRYLNSLNSSKPVTFIAQNENSLFSRVKYFLNNPEKVYELGEIGYKAVKEGEKHVVSSVLSELIVQSSMTIPE